MYMRRMGSSWMSGPLFEIKLISLLYFRAFHNKAIEEFQLASNVDGIGVFDDICIRAKVKGFDKPICVFIQTRHQENKIQIPTIDLFSYFDSYFKIRQLFNPSSKDEFFTGNFDETECFFVIYKTARDDINNNDFKVESSLCSVLNDLFATGDTAKQMHNQEEHLKILYKAAMKKQMVSLAEEIAKFITVDDGNFETMLYNDTIFRFHVILAREVIDVSEIQPAGHRVATFRPEFFDNKEEYLAIFKCILIKQILNNRKMGSTDNTVLSENLVEPTDTTKLDKMMDQLTTKCLMKMLNLVSFSHPQLTVNLPVKLAANEARKILPSLQFKVPASFGNKDLTLRGNDEKKEKIINYLASKITSIVFDNCETSKIVTIDESLGSGFLQLNGGITGAIGNLFVLDDDNSKLMKITDNPEQLGPLAKRLYTKLNCEIRNLHEYKFCFQLTRCPNLSFKCGYEENLAKDFLNRLLIYSGQAMEDEVENILKKGITDLQSEQAEYFQVNDDVIFLRYFDLMQKWWSQRHKAPYLTRNYNLFRESTNHIIKDPLISSINLICKSKINKYGFTFNENVVRSLNLLNQYMSTVIIAENSVLTVAKVMQHLQNKYHVILDFEYIADLPADNRNSLCIELINTVENRVMILVCDETNFINDITSLKNIGDAVRYKKTIIVTNQTTFKIIQKYFPKADKILHDKKLSLMDLDEASQKSVVETATATFPGVDIRLDQLLMGCPKPTSK